MNRQEVSHRHGELGGARAKLLVFLVLFGAVIYGGYLYVPVAIDSYYFRDVMQSKVEQAMAQGYDGVWLKDQLVKVGADYHVPADAIITPSVSGGRMEVRVQFTRPISIPGYTYNYEFDYTVHGSTFLTGK